MTGFDTAAAVSRAAFGTLPTGEPVELFTLVNTRGTTVRFLSYGGIITSILTPDRHGELGDIVLGYDDMASYLANEFYFGALIGRSANRIAEGRLPIDGEEFQLTINNGPNHLHGGTHGFHAALWRVELFEQARERGAVLRHSSAAGDDGYPGLVEARVTYTLTDDDELVIAYHATTDTPTPVNLTQHTYFNLTGQAGTDILQHELQLDASRFTPVNDVLIPLGEHRDVTETPFDFREPRPVGSRIHEADPQLALGGGYDHNFVLDTNGAAETVAARLVDPSSGRVLELLTSAPGVQLYAGGTFTPGMTGKGGGPIPRSGGLALETQHFPDAPNQPSFPSTILRPGETYESTTVWRFVTVA